MLFIRNAVFAAFIIFTAGSLIFAQNLKPEEIVAKHLESIGTREARTSLKTLIATGMNEFESKNPEVKGNGKAVVVSDPDNLFFALSFKSKEYPFEKIGYFNKKIEIPLVNADKRSLLGAFIVEHGKF